VRRADQYGRRAALKVGSACARWAPSIYGFTPWRFSARNGKLFSERLTFLARRWTVSSDQPEKQRDACPLLELSPQAPIK
jgi:hypothetical protein